LDEKGFLGTCTIEISICILKQYSTLAYIGAYTYRCIAYFCVHM